MTTFEDFNITQLKKIIRAYNLHSKIIVSKKTKEELITEMKKHLKIEGDFIKLIEKEFNFDSKQVMPQKKEKKVKAKKEEPKQEKKEVAKPDKKEEPKQEKKKGKMSEAKIKQEVLKMTKAIVEKEKDAIEHKMEKGKDKEFENKLKKIGEDVIELKTFVKDNLDDMSKFDDVLNYFSENIDRLRSEILPKQVKKEEPKAAKDYEDFYKNVMEKERMTNYGNLDLLDKIDRLEKVLLVKYKDNKKYVKFIEEEIEKTKKEIKEQNDESEKSFNKIIKTTAEQWKKDDDKGSSVLKLVQISNLDDIYKIDLDYSKIPTYIKDFIIKYANEYRAVQLANKLKEKKKK